MKNKLQIITKENELFGQVRFTIIDGKEYAVANDVAISLGYKSPKDSVRMKCKGAIKCSLPTNGGIQKFKVIPESDIYRLIFGSKLPNAEKFQDWVFDEVLPQIRQTGGDIPVQETIGDNRIGETNKNNFGTKMTIIEYNNSQNVKIEFENGFTTTSRYSLFKNGQIKSPYDKTIYNTGYFGEGKYKSSINNKNTKEYNYWRAMMRRCYDEKTKINLPTYKYCTVCEEWHNFQNFAKWFDENYYEIDNEKMCLDKDILIKGNKIYSPETCVFVPEYINNLFTKCNKSRGKYPIGVYYSEKRSKFRVGININKKLNCGKYFNTAEEAFKVYKNMKEKEIKRIADEYKDKIPKRVYDAMYKYKVDIND